MKTNATTEQLQNALIEVNKKYDNNVIFNRLEVVSSKRNLFTLRVKDSQKSGHRIGFCLTSKGNHRKLINACWHVHGDFFDSLFAIDKDIYILSGGKRITSQSGNWEDRNIGSTMQPMYFSEACDC